MPRYGVVTCDCGTCPKCRNREKMRRFRAANPDYFATLERLRRQRNPEGTRAHDRAEWNSPEFAAKRAAYNAVRAARNRGDLVRPDACEQCGSGDHIEAHHDDYSKPLEVRWLCRACHKFVNSQGGG